MGFLLKIAIFAVVVYGVWTTARRWLRLFGGPKPPGGGPSRESPPARPVVVEDTRLCTACGAYVAAGAAKCDRPQCPQP